MQFIQDKLNERGALKFAVHTHDNADGKDSTDQYINETSNLIVDPTSCNISYHRTHKKNGAVEADADVNLQPSQCARCGSHDCRAELEALR